MPTPTYTDTFLRGRSVHADPQLSLFQRLWPKVLIGCGVGLTLLWGLFLGYRVLSLIYFRMFAI